MCHDQEKKNVGKTKKKTLNSVENVYILIGNQVFRQVIDDLFLTSQKEKGWKARAPRSEWNLSVKRLTNPRFFALLCQSRSYLINKNILLPFVFMNLSLQSGCTWTLSL